jgi:hypothetical protein
MAALGTDPPPLSGSEAADRLSFCVLAGRRGCLEWMRACEGLLAPPYSSRADGLEIIIEKLACGVEVIVLEVPGAWKGPMMDISCHLGFRVAEGVPTLVSEEGARRTRVRTRSAFTLEGPLSPRRVGCVQPFRRNGLTDASPDPFSEKLSDERIAALLPVAGFGDSRAWLQHHWPRAGGGALAAFEDVFRLWMKSEAPIPAELIS